MSSIPQGSYSALSAIGYFDFREWGRGWQTWERPSVAKDFAER